MNLSKITARAEILPNGKTRYTVEFDGRVVETRTSKVADYSVIHIQRWLPVGATPPAGSREDAAKFAAEDYFAVRYSRKPKAAGARIDYGYCAGNVEIEVAS